MYRDDAEAAAARAAALERELADVREARARTAERIAALAQEITVVAAEHRRLRRPQRLRRAAVLGAIALLVTGAAVVGARGGIAYAPDDPTTCDDAKACFDQGFAAAQRKDMTTAARLYLRGCNGGGAWSCTNLGAQYADGAGVTRDDVAADLLYRLACQDGDQLGCNNDAELMEAGRVRGGNVGAALLLYRDACAAGEKKACDNLVRLAGAGAGK